MTDRTAEYQEVIDGETLGILTGAAQVFGVSLGELLRQVAERIKLELQHGQLDPTAETQAQDLGVLVDGVERIRGVLLGGDDLDREDVQALHNMGSTLIDFAAQLRGEDPLPSLTEAECQAVRFAILRGMWTEGGICRNCCCWEGKGGKARHAETCDAQIALTAMERLRPAVPKGAAVATLPLPASAQGRPCAACRALQAGAGRR